MTGEQRSFLPLLLFVLGGILVLRLISLWFNNSQLFFDEAQYWVWSQYPDFGYFSKPPMLAWIIAITTDLAGSDSEFFVRLAAPVFHTLTAVVLFFVGRDLFDARTGFWSAITYALLPGISLSATIISTDVPLLFFWSLALFAFIRLEQGGGYGTALLMGAAIGAGLMSKYAMAYFFACVILYCLFVSSRPHLLVSAKLWFGFTIAFLCLAPNIWWNWKNDFATVSHTGDNIDWQGFNLEFDELGEFVGSQFGVFGPILFAMYLLMLLSFFRKGISRKQGLLVAFSFPVLLVICAQALMNKAFANWAAVTYVGATLLVVDLLVNRARLIWNKISTTIHVVVFAAISVAVAFASPGQLVLPDGREPFERTQGADVIGDQVRRELENGEYAATITMGRRLSALVPYQLRDRPERKLAWRFFDVPMDHFEMKFAFQDMPIEPALVVARDRFGTEWQRFFSSVKDLGSRTIGNGEVEKIHLYRVSGFKNDDRGASQ